MMHLHWPKQMLVLLLEAGLYNLNYNGSKDVQDVAIDAAQIVLMRDDLQAVPEALYISLRTFRRIAINLVWAMVYNVLGCTTLLIHTLISLAIPTAAGLLLPFIHPYTLPPAIAGLTMAFSSVSVVVSSLLLPYKLKCV